jgi:hypothetical protein
LEERRASLNLRLHHVRWRDLEAALFDMGLAESAKNSCAYFHNRAGLVTAQNKMAVVQERLGVSAFLHFVGNGLVVACRDANDSEIVHV